jgi:cytochrome c biogenesis factor
MIAVGFLLFILLTSNPFLRTFPPAANGRGLNPVLQDPGLAFHPPFLYLGYVGFSVAFSFAVAALIEGRVDAAWARWVRPWTLASWCALTVGIAMGSWWAYYTLGWGGWWFWDPVENASFMPWLVGTALIHSSIVVEKRDTCGCATVFLGTLYPLFLDAMSGPKLSVGFPFFNRTFAPMMVPMVIAVGIGPMLAWKRGDLLGALQRLWVAYIATALVILVAFYVTYGGPVLAVLGLGLAAWLSTAVLTEFAERIRLFRIPFGASVRRAIHLPRSTYGMSIAHFGLAVSVAGFAASAFAQEAIEILKPGGSIAIAGYELTLEHVDRLQGPNYTADDAAIRVTSGGTLVTTMHPERRFFPLQKQTTGETAIRTNLLADLYVALGDSDTQGAWTVRVYWKPLVPWIWIGAIIMAFGGVVSLSDRRWRVGVASRTARRGPQAVPAVGE